MNDWDIRDSHSSVIFNAFLDPYLPGTHPDIHRPLLMSAADWHSITAQQAIRAEERKNLVSHVDVRNFGTIDSFTAGDRKIVLLKTTDGAHDIGRIEGVQDVIGRTFGLL